MSLVAHAEREMRLAGLYEEDADYGGMIPNAVNELMKVFSAQGHSGYSAMIVLNLFIELAQFKTLTPITSNPDEWQDVSEYSGGRPMWQNNRCPSVFSKDGGATWYDLDGPTKANEKDAATN